MLNNFKSVEFQRKQRHLLSKKIEKMSTEDLLAYFSKSSQKELKKRISKQKKLTQFRVS